MKDIYMGDVTKLVVCCLVVIAAVILGVSRTISGEAVSVLVSGVLGYVFGNGHGIASAQRKMDRPLSSPTYRRRDQNGSKI